MVELGAWVIGTPDDAIAAIERLQERSGGFGGLLVVGHEWAAAGGHGAQLGAAGARRGAALPGLARGDRGVQRRSPAPAAPCTGEERVAAVEAAQRAYESGRGGA